MSTGRMEGTDRKETGKERTKKRGEERRRGKKEKKK